MTLPTDTLFELWVWPRYARRHIPDPVVRYTGPGGLPVTRIFKDLWELESFFLDMARQLSVPVERLNIRWIERPPLRKKPPWGWTKERMKRLAEQYEAEQYEKPGVRLSRPNTKAIVADPRDPDLKPKRRPKEDV